MIAAFRGCLLSKVRHPRGKRIWIAAEGIAVLGFALGSIVAAPYTIVPAVYVALMIAGSWTIPLITSYLPHDPKATDELHQTRLFRGVIVRVAAFDHLYHLEHHLYPAVPHQNWPRLARRLDPWFEAAGIQPVRVGEDVPSSASRVDSFRSAERPACSANGCDSYSGSHSH